MKCPDAVLKLVKSSPSQPAVGAPTSLYLWTAVYVSAEQRLKDGVDQPCEKRHAHYFHRMLWRLFECASGASNDLRWPSLAVIQRPRRDTWLTWVVPEFKTLDRGPHDSQSRRGLHYHMPDVAAVESRIYRGDGVPCFNALLICLCIVVAVIHYFLLGTTW